MRSYYHNPYYSCYPQYKFGYLSFVNKKNALYDIEKDLVRYQELINKAFVYAYNISIREMIKKLKRDIDIGKQECADDRASIINDVFYLKAYIHAVIMQKLLYETKTCRDKFFLECLKRYWYCKRIDVTPILKEFELSDCTEDGIDYMIIIDPLVNPIDMPPNQVK